MERSSAESDWYIAIERRGRAPLAPFSLRRALRFAVPSSATVRLGIGLIALVCLLAVEFTVVLWLQGITLRESIANRDPVSGAVYAASLILFALMPFFAGRATQIAVRF